MISWVIKKATIMEITLTDGTKMRCEDQPFSSGAEGELFFSENKDYVVKLYHRDPKTGVSDPQRRKFLDNIVGKFNLIREDKSRSLYFGWPDGIIVYPRLGIRMPNIQGARPLDFYIRPKSWQSLPINERGNWKTRLSIAFRMARIMRWMHNRGLCHSDLSPRNFLVNMRTAQTTLIDCDGLVVPGVQPPSVLGTPQCMAPEIVSDLSGPTVNTDKHALAVLIYWVLLLRHPLQGPKFHHKDTERDEQLMYGERALFIEHPMDHTNRPKSLPFTSDLFTPQVKKLFNLAFIDGLHNPTKRPAAAEWESALQRMADRIVPCQNPSCAMKEFVTHDIPLFKCPWCDTPYRSPGGYMPIAHFYKQGNKPGNYESDNWSMAVCRGRHLSTYHANIKEYLDHRSQPISIAYFEVNKKGVWQLKNDGAKNLRVIGSTSPLKHGDSVEIDEKIKIILDDNDKANSRVITFQMLRTA